MDFKKPKVKVYKYEPLNVSNGSKYLTEKEVGEAYKSMIDALIDGLNDTLDFGEITVETEEKFKQALKKAGCIDATLN